MMAGTLLSNSLRNGSYARTSYFYLSRSQQPVKPPLISSNLKCCHTNCTCVATHLCMGRVWVSPTLEKRSLSNIVGGYFMSARNFSLIKYDGLSKGYFVDSGRKSHFLIKECSNSINEFESQSRSLALYSRASKSYRRRLNESLLCPVDCNKDTIRNYAKGKDKAGKGGKGKGRVNITTEELNQVVNAANLEKEYDEALEQLRDSFVNALAIRTNVGSLDDLPVELEGDSYPLNEIAQVHRKSPQLIVINCAAFPQAAKGIMEAIANSGMNLNPQQDGTTIAVPLPKVTREHREGLSSKAKELCNKCKDSLRQVHSTYVRKTKAKEGADISVDLLFLATQKIKEMQDDRMKEAEKMLLAKQAELLKS